MTTSPPIETCSGSASRPSFLHFLPEQSMYLPNPSGLGMNKFTNRHYPTTKALRRSSNLLRFNNDLSFVSNFCGSWISSNISLLSWSFALCKELISRVYSSVARKICWFLDLPANISGAVKNGRRSIQISNQGDEKRNTRSGLSFQSGLLFHCGADLNNNKKWKSLMEVKVTQETTCLPSGSTLGGQLFTQLLRDLLLLCKLPPGVIQLGLHLAERVRLQYLRRSRKTWMNPRKHQGRNPLSQKWKILLVQPKRSLPGIRIKPSNQSTPVPEVCYPILHEPAEVVWLHLAVRLLPRVVQWFNLQIHVLRVEFEPQNCRSKLSIFQYSLPLQHIVFVWLSVRELEMQV